LAAVALALLLPKLSRRKRISARALAAVVIGGVVLAALGFVFWGLIDQIVVEPITLALRPGAAESDALRRESVLLGVQAWLQHPLFGGGLGTFLHNRETAGLQAVVIHSVPVWFLAEMGLVGLAAYGFFAVSILFCGLVAMRRKDPRATGLIIAVTVFVLMGLVHDLFFQRSFWFASGLMLLLAGEVSVRPQNG
jgi:O-antigen ligase